jgi:uncharacterized protein involved in exopolysaccharide biosynthesis
MRNTPQVEEEDEGLGLGTDVVRGWVSFALRALRKYAWAPLVGLGLGIAGAALVTWALPDYYLVEANLAAQRSDIIASFGNPGRPHVAEWGSRGYGAQDLMKRRESLLALVEQVDLLDDWRAHRSPAGRIKDRLTFGRKLTDDELRRALVKVLDQRLLVWSDEGSVRVLITWPDADMAFRLVDGVVQNYIETRHVTEMAMLGESIQLLQERLASAEEALNEALDVARKARPRASARARRADPEPATSIVPSGMTMDLLRIRSEIASQRRTLDDLVSFRERRISQLQAELDEKRAVLGELHPTIVTLRASLAALTEDSPQIVALRRDIQDLESRYVASGGKLSDLDALDFEITTSPTRATTPAVIAALEGPLRDPAEEFARSKLAAAMVRYNVVADRLEAAQTERDAMTASNKYRYLVVKPPLRPREPVNRGKKRMVWAAGSLAGLLFGVLGAFVLAYREGRIVQMWQVEHGLGLPILAELPPAPRKLGGS